MQEEICKLIISHCLANRLPWLVDDDGTMYLDAKQIASFYGWSPKTLENRMSEARGCGWKFAEHPAKPNMFSFDSVKQGLVHAAQTKDQSGQR